MEDENEEENEDEDLGVRLKREALEALEEEPELCMLLHKTVLAPDVVTFEDAVASTVCYRMLMTPCVGGSGGSSSNKEHNLQFCPIVLRSIFDDAFQQKQHQQQNDDDLILESLLKEGGNTVRDAVRKDVLAVLQRDPACETILEVILFCKGFAALVCHRAARQKWILQQYMYDTQNTNTSNKTRRKKRSSRRSLSALFLQSQASAAFAIDIHPGATIGAGVMFDHGTGIVIGETAVVGDGCTLLHGVTLGGSGKTDGDRHPKVGRDVLIGAGTSIIGNIKIGNRAKIGAGSIVLRPIPEGATAVGVPARIIGRSLEARPGTNQDTSLLDVGHLATGGGDNADNNKSIRKQQKLESSVVTSTTATLDSTEEQDKDSSLSSDSSDTKKDSHHLCPYQNYTSVRARKGTITFCQLRSILSEYKCIYSKEEGNNINSNNNKKRGIDLQLIGAIFLELDTKHCGYITVNTFQKKAPSVFTKFLSSDIIESIALNTTSNSSSEEQQQATQILVDQVVNKVCSE